jgi:hypothetical protein
MKARKNPTEKQLLRRMQREPIGCHDPRARNDAYWALRHQGYPDAFARRALRDMLPHFYRDKVHTSGEYIDDVAPEDLLFVPETSVEIAKLAVVVRPDLTEEIAATAASRAREYTIWSQTTPGFGLRVHPSGDRTYIVMFRVRGHGRQGKISLGKPGNLSLDLARRVAREVRLEALAGRDPRPMHRNGELLRRVK